MKRILITGSSGRIGRAIHWQLQHKYDLIGIDLSPSSATTHICDIRSYEDLVVLLQNIDTVFHCAALHAPHVGIMSDKTFYEINVNSTENVCRAAQEVGVKKLIFTSTTALYGYANTEDDKAVWVNEQTLPKPRTIYHKTKLEAEALLETYASPELNIRSMRMSRCFPEPCNLMAIYRLHRGVDYRDVAKAHIMAALLEENKPFDKYVVSGQSYFRRSGGAFF